MGDNLRMSCRPLPLRSRLLRSVRTCVLAACALTLWQGMLHRGNCQNGGLWCCFHPEGRVQKPRSFLSSVSVDLVRARAVLSVATETCHWEELPFLPGFPMLCLLSYTFLLVGQQLSCLLAAGTSQDLGDQCLNTMKPTRKVRCECGMYLPISSLPLGTQRLRPGGDIGRADILLLTYDSGLSGISSGW